MFFWRYLLYQIYLFQLENYEIRRYWRVVLKKIWRSAGAWRQDLVWTLKLRVVSFLAFCFDIVFVFWLASGFSGYFFWLFFLVFLSLSLFLHFVFLSVAALLLWPIDFCLKNILLFRAKRKLASFSEVKRIAVAGSYGKTTMKEMLAAVLSEKFEILKTPENINTPLGVARLILRELRPSTEIFIVEMGAYQRGDIAALCALTPPAVSVLTGINESHLERFGSLANTVAAKFEVIDALPSAGIAVLNSDNELIAKNYQKHLKKQKIFFYAADSQPLSPCRIISRHYAADNAGQSFVLVDELAKEHKLKTDFLGDYIAGTIMACFLIARELGLTNKEIAAGVALCRPVEHRLKPLFLANGSMVIDDSYNGNPVGVREAIKVLSRFSGRRKIYITPGLVEMGSAAQAVHEAIGRDLGKVADLVVLVRNSVTPFIRDGLAAAGFPEKHILWFNKITDAHSVLPQLIKKGDVVLFQNDWPDNYF